MNLCEECGSETTVRYIDSSIEAIDIDMLVPVCQPCAEEILGQPVRAVSYTLGPLRTGYSVWVKTND